MKRLIVIRSGSTAWAEAAQAEIARCKCQQVSMVENALAFPQGASSTAVAEDERRLQGTLPLPLSEQGKVALVGVAEMLKKYDISCIYSSGNESSGPTAEFLAELCRSKTKKNPDLKEMNCGLWQGLRFKDIEKRYNNAYKQWRSDPESICPPNGETFSDCRDRIEESLVCILRKSKCETVVMVVAEIAAAIIECLLTGKDPKKFWEVADKGKLVQVYEINNIDKSKIPTGTIVEF